MDEELRDNPEQVIDYQTIERADVGSISSGQTNLQIDASCLFGLGDAQCASGGGAEVHDSRTFVEVDTQSLADALVTSAQCFSACVVVAVGLHGAWAAYRERARRG